MVKKGQQKLVLKASEHQLPVERVSKFAVKVIKRLKQAGYQAYLVGGGVRDLLLGKTPKDFDVSTNATPEQVKRLFNNARIIGRRFKIVHIVYLNDIIEVTTFRGGTSDQLHVDNAIPREGKRFEVQVNPEGMLVRDNSYGTHIEDDAQRRDFTINAIYLDIQTGELIDFHGGLYDLTQGVIDIIGDPETRYREDPVRILRAARFSAKLGFKLSPRTVAFIPPCAELLHSVSPARMYDEVNKLFLTGHAEASFKVLTALGLFEELFTLSPMLLYSSTCRDFLCHAFASTDQRYAEGKCNKPHFLYAIILWNEFIWNFYQMRDELMFSANSIDYKGLISYLAAQVVIRQFQITAMPEQIIRSIALLWRLQFLLESKDPQKYVKETTSYLAFRAAFDLFKLRATFDANLQSRVDFWQPYYDQCKADAEKRRRNQNERREERTRRRNDRYDRRNFDGNGNNGGMNADSFERDWRSERDNYNERHSNSRNDRRRRRNDRDSNNNFERYGNDDFQENASDRQSRIKKARSWRQSMNLEP